MSADDIGEAFIRPMLATFPAPTHLRGNPAATEHALNVYRRALSKFDRPTLEKGWQRVAEQNEIWCWPKVAEAVRACEHFQPRKRPEPERESWVERATALSDAYTRRFMKISQAAVKAREGNYDQQLKGYVSACAWVQAQAICGRRGFGYDHYQLFGKGPRDEEAEAEFFEKARRQAESGSIRVSVTKDVIERCKERAEKQSRGR